MGISFIIILDMEISPIDESPTLEPPGIASFRPCLSTTLFRSFSPNRVVVVVVVVVGMVDEVG